jgi:16S rRNA (guanine966-N2)-methyltransferase
VTFVERDRAAAAAIRAHIEEWRETAATVECNDALAWLARGSGGSGRFDIVFLDPPYDSPLLSQAAAALQEQDWLSADARVYLERPAREEMATLPPAWRELRSGRAGEVGYHLFSN